MNLKARVIPFGLAALPLVLSQCSSSDTEPNDPTTAANTSGSTSTLTSSMTVSTSASTTSTTSATTSTTSTASSSSANTTSTTGSGTTGSSTTTGAGGGTMTGTLTGAGGAGGTGAGGTGNVGGEFTLTSSELEEGAEFMPKHTCELSGFGNDESPPFAWTGAPAAAQSFALVFLDTTLTDAGDALGYHWVMWDIPASVSELPANLPTGATITTPVSAKQYNTSYLGPCPNFGGGGDPETHTYVFTLYAMPEAETAALAGLNNVQQLEAAIKEVALDSATLSGTSDASPP